MRQTIQERFWSKVRITNTCWLWMASCNKDGYGVFRLNRSMKKAHRMSYAWVLGEISEGFELDHLCRHRNCVRPNHLEPVTHLENMRRGDITAMGAPNRDKTYCIKGHEFTKENTYLTKDCKRSCRECMRVFQRAAYARRDTL